MKKLFALFFVFALIFYGANKAEASIWSDIGTAFGNFIDWVVGGKTTESIEDFWNKKQPCDEAFKRAGEYADDYEKTLPTIPKLPDPNLPPKDAVRQGSAGGSLTPIEGANIKDPGAAVGGATDPTLPKSPGDGNVSVPEKINFNLYKIFFNEAKASDDDDENKDPCAELERDRKAAQDKQKPGSGSSPDDAKGAEIAEKNIKDVLDRCCIRPAGEGGGGGKGDGREGDKLGIETTTTTWPIGLPDPDLNPSYQYAACDYTSPDFNKMHKCVLKEKFEPGDIPCDVNQNQTRIVDPASMDQQSQQNFISKFTNWIAGLFGAQPPYVGGPIQVVYNPACYQGATPPPTGPTPPPTGPGATIPGQPPVTVPGVPGAPEKPVVPPTIPSKPRDPDPEWCQIQDFFWLTKNVFTENSEVKVKKDKKEHFTLIGYPKGGVLEQTGLDYAIMYCEQCNMTIRSLKDEKDLTRFIKDNDIFTKDLEPMIIDEKYPLFWYSYQNAGQLYHPQVENLPIGQYELTITCKSKEGEIVTKSIRLSRLPVFRWREVAPVSKND